MENTDLIIPAPVDPLKKHKRHFSKIGLFYFCGAIIISAVQVSVITLIQLIAPQLMTNPNISLLISSLSMYLIAMPLLVIIVRTIPHMVIRKKKMTIGQWLIAFFMCYALMYVTNLIGTFTTAVFGVLKGDLVDNPLQDLLVGLSPITAFFLMVICAPIVEEYIFLQTDHRPDSTIRTSDRHPFIRIDVCLVPWQLQSICICIYARCVLGIHLCKNRTPDLYGCSAYDSKFLRIDSRSAYDEINFL